MSGCSSIRTKLKEAAKHFADNHPYISYFVLLVGVPIVILTFITIAIIIIFLPLSLIFGWI